MLLSSVRESGKIRCPAGFEGSNLNLIPEVKGQRPSNLGQTAIPDSKAYLKI